MTVAEFLTSLSNLGVNLSVDGERLRVNAPAGVLSDEQRHQLSERKSEIVTFVRTAKRLAGQQRAIVPLKPNGTRTPIFGVGGHNGDVFCYHNLIRHLDGGQPFYGLQPRGIEEGSEPCTSVETLAGYFAEQIRDFRPQGSVALAGYCAGGTVAFELARQLSGSGREVSRLILFGAAYCGSYHLLPGLAFDCRQILTRAPVHARALFTRAPAEWPRYVSERLHRTETTPPDAVMARRRAVEKATLAAIRRYEPRPFEGRVDIMLPRASWKHSWAKPLRWRRHAASGAEFAGPAECTAETMLLEPERAAIFASFLNTALESAPRRVAGACASRR